jgi:hypothetical protein
MNAAVPVAQASGSPPLFGNCYAIFWSLLNILIPVAIVALIIWYIRYLRKQSSYRTQLLEKLDSLIRLLQTKNIDDI